MLIPTQSAITDSACLIAKCYEPSFTPSPRAVRRLAATARLTALSGALLLGASSTAHADAINIDFNNDTTPTYSGRGAASDTGTFWNGIDAVNLASMSNLKNSTGTTTGVSVTFDRGGINDRPTGVGASGNVAAALLEDYLTTTGSNTVILSGLTTGTTYSLYLYGVGSAAQPTPGNNASRASFTVGGTTQNTTGPNAATTTLTSGEDYVVFNNLRADTNNSISINYATVSPDTRGAFNGLQLQYAAPVPEPSTWAMMALGVGALGLMTRRKRSSDAV